MSAVIKENHIETIFDYDISDNEMLTVLGIVESKDDYLYHLSQDDTFGDIYHLLILRGEKKQAKSILKKIKNKRFISDLIRVSCCDKALHSQLLRENHPNSLA